MIDTNEKLEALDKQRKKLEKDLNQIRDYVRQSGNYIKMQENVNFQIDATMKNNKKMRSYKVELMS